jgi:hypothetical protein
VHKAIGVFGAVSVATAACLPGSVAASVARLPATTGEVAVSVEHPTGEFTALLTLSDGEVISAALLRTARLLMAGQVMIPHADLGRPPMNPRIALIGFGEVGQILGRDLAEQGVDDITAYDRLFLDPTSALSRTAALAPGAGRLRHGRRPAGTAIWSSAR